MLSYASEMVVTVSLSAPTTVRTYDAEQTSVTSRYVGQHGTCSWTNNAIIISTTGICHLKDPE